MEWNPDDKPLTLIYDDSQVNIFNKFSILEDGYENLNKLIQDMVGHGSFVGTDENDYKVSIQPLLFFKQYIPRVFQFKPILRHVDSIIKLKWLLENEKRERGYREDQTEDKAT
jgi:hypothetical protein